MISRPAAGAGETTALGVIHQRLYEFLGQLPEHSRELLADSLLPAGHGSSAVNPASRNDFYWLLFPEWLAAKDEQRLRDVLWAQYCLYCLLRVQDDVVDGDAKSLHLAVAGNLLASEATRALAPHFDAASPLWEYLRRAVDTTSTALIEIDRRQLVPERNGLDDLPLYAKLSRCLTVATYAVLLADGRDREWPLVARVLDQLAVAGQLLDDFHDLEQDLTAGCYNFAAWHLTRPVFARSAEAVQAIVASNLATSGRLAEMLAHARRPIIEAEKLLESQPDSRFTDYVARFRRTVDAIEESFGERRQQLLHGPLH